MFSNGQNVQAADLNNFSVATVTTTGDVTVGDDLAVTDDATIGGDLAVTGSLSVGGVPVTASVGRDTCCGRLTLTSGTPVTSTDVTAAGTLFWALYKGNQIALYSGTEWVLFAIAQLSITVPAVANQVYDVFVNYNAGVPALALTAWTNDTTRATALTTQDGVLVKTGSTGQRYVGTVRTVTASQLNDSLLLRHVWNYYHRVVRPMRRVETTDNWAYTTATIRQANGAAANQLDFVCGVAEDAIEANVFANWSQSNASIYALVGIGLDSTSAVAAGCLYSAQGAAGAGYKMQAVANYRAIPAVGRHTLVWLEFSEAGTGTTTFYGDTDGAVVVQSGIHGMWYA